MTKKVQHGPLYLLANEYASLRPNMPKRGNLPFVLNNILSGLQCTFFFVAVRLRVGDTV